MAKKKNEQALKFAGVVRAKLDEKRISLKFMADELKVPYNSLRQWLTRNVFPKEPLLDLARRLGLPTEVESLVNDYGVQIARPRLPMGPSSDITLPEAFRRMDQRIDRLDPSGRIQEALGEDVDLLLRSMGDGDLFAFWCLDTTAYEMTGAGWVRVGRSLAQAIKRGVTCIYLHPSNKLLDSLREHCGLRRLPLETMFKAAFEDLVQNLRRIPVEDALTKSRAVMDETYIRKHALNISTEHAAFAAPEHKYVLFRSGSMSRVLAQFPTGSSSSKKFLLPLEPNVSNQFYDFVDSCLKAARQRPGSGAHFDWPVV